MILAVTSQKTCRYYRCQDGSWEEIEESPAMSNYDERAYFPVYSRRDRVTRDDGEFYLVEDLEEFPSNLEPLEKKGQEVESDM
jgi:hypothetical protein